MSYLLDTQIYNLFLNKVPTVFSKKRPDYKPDRSLLNV